MTAPTLLGAVSSVLGPVWIASPALAYHGAAEHGGAPFGAILPIVVVVVAGVIALSFWKPRSRNAKTKKRDRAPGYRTSHKGQKRGR